MWLGCNQCFRHFVDAGQQGSSVLTSSLMPYLSEKADLVVIVFNINVAYWFDVVGGGGATRRDTDLKFTQFPGALVS